MLSMVVSLLKMSVLKMLGLYLVTLIIIHGVCSMLSILNALKVKNDLQNNLENNVF